MPLANVEISGINCRLAMWTLEESSGELLQLFSSDDEIFDDFDTSQTEKRKKEWLATRLLVRELMGKYVRIHYTDKGRPYLENNGLQISISHSSSYVVLGISPGRVGVDIQAIGRHAMVRGRDFFLNEKEIAALPGTSEREPLYLYWSIKEAVYKYVSMDVDMKNDLTIDYSGDGASCFCEIRLSDSLERVQVFHWFRGGYVLTVAC